MSVHASPDCNPSPYQTRGPDRRSRSRSGRRAGDPHVSAWYWRRLAWLFAGYVAYLSVRSLPSSVRKKWFKDAQQA